jgi:hypothetical protein
MMTTTVTTMVFPLHLGIDWGERGLLTAMTTTLTVIDMKTDNNSNNHGVPTLSRDRLGGKGSFDNNDNYTDRH